MWEFPFLFGKKLECALASKSISMPFAVKFLGADFEKFGFCLQIISQKKVHFDKFFCNLQFLMVSFSQGLQAYKIKSSPVLCFMEKRGILVSYIHV